MIFDIDEEQQKKIKLWLSEIRIDDEYFGDIGTVIIVKERTTNKELDITDTSKW